MKRFLNILLVALLMASAAAVTFAVTYTELRTAPPTSPAASKVAEAETYIDRFFIDEYDKTLLGDAAVAGIVAATGDEWSYYISAEQYDDYTEQLNNAYVGIGVTILLDEARGGFVIRSVTPGGPADLGGVQVDDVLIEVEGESALALGQEEVVSRVRGPEGTEITLTFTRAGEVYDVTLLRSSISTEVATLQMTEDNIAVITILNFDHKCAEQTLAAVESALEQNAAALVFDVRNNPGGLKDEMVKILDRLLPEGVLFRSVNYEGVEEEDISDEIFLDLPMAVVVNEESYSAAEFFAAALQEYEAARVVGTKTYGKGNFQNTFPLSDGSALVLSVGKYYTPNGVSLSGVGITPDVEIDLDDEQFALLYYGRLPMEEDPQLQAALAAVREST